MVFEIPALPLAPGKYSLNLFLDPAPGRKGSGRTALDCQIVDLRQRPDPACRGQSFPAAVRLTFCFAADPGEAAHEPLRGTASGIQGFPARQVSATGELVAAMAGDGGQEPGGRREGRRRQGHPFHHRGRAAGYSRTQWGRQVHSPAHDRRHFGPNNRQHSHQREGHFDHDPGRWLARRLERPGEHLRRWGNPGKVAR
jgi:hypothetical protein